MCFSAIDLLDWLISHYPLIAVLCKVRERGKREKERKREERERERKGKGRENERKQQRRDKCLPAMMGILITHFFIILFSLLFFYF